MANKCVSCNNCGHTGWSKNRGNFLITIVLLIFFFVPGVIYEIWRRTGLGVCSNCGSDRVVPLLACDTKDRNFQLDVMGIVIVTGSIVVGIMAVIFLCMIVYVGVERFIKTGSFLPPKSSEDLYSECFKDDMEHYQSLKQFPMMPDGKTLTMDRIEIDCKGSINGKYPR